VPVPEHAPDQPVNVEPDDGVAVRVACAPDTPDVVQDEPQEIDPPDDVTVPDPTPPFDTVRVYVGILIAQDAEVPPFVPKHCQMY
jgi:hypothetical protein